MNYVVYVKPSIWRVADKFQADYNYVTDSQEIYHILDMVGLGHIAQEITALFVLVGDGEYKEIWVTESSKPYIINTAYERVIWYYRRPNNYRKA